MEAKHEKREVFFLLLFRFCFSLFYGASARCHVLKYRRCLLLKTPFLSFPSPGVSTCLSVCAFEVETTVAECAGRNKRILLKGRRKQGEKAKKKKKKKCGRKAEFKCVFF